MRRGAAFFVSTGGIAVGILILATGLREILQGYLAGLHR